MWPGSHSIHLPKHAPEARPAAPPPHPALARPALRRRTSAAARVVWLSGGRPCWMAPATGGPGPAPPKGVGSQ
jgi:hypothetical protein